MLAKLGSTGSDDGTMMNRKKKLFIRKIRWAASQLYGWEGVHH